MIVLLLVVPRPDIKGPETVTEGESLILECIAEGYPDARVVWVPPPTSSVAEVQGRGSAILRVDRVTADEEGIYTCYIYTDVDQYEKTITVTGRITTCLSFTLEGEMDGKGRGRECHRVEIPDENNPRVFREFFWHSE